MKTLSITMMAIATGFGIFTLIHAKRSGTYDQLYQSEARLASNQDHAALSHLKDSATIMEVMNVESRPISDIPTVKKQTPKVGSTVLSDGRLSAALVAQFDSVYTEEVIEGMFEIEIDTLANVEQFEFNPGIFSRAIPSKEQSDHYKQASRYIKSKILEIQARNKPAPDLQAGH